MTDSLKIGENKNGRETAINAAFAELMHSWLGDLGRLRLYSETMQPSQRMEEFVADVYLGIGELAVDSQKYYLRPSYGMLVTKALYIGETDS